MTEAQSNFTSGTLGSAWYINQRGASRKICRTTGFSLLATLKENLRDTLRRTGPLPTSGGTTIAAEQIIALELSQSTGAVSGEGWTTDTLRGLFAVAQRARVSAVYTAAIQNDLQIGRLRPGRVLSTSTMQAAVWFAEESGVDGTETLNTGEVVPATLWGSAGSPSEVGFGDNPVLPNFGTVPEVPADRQIQSGAVCVPDVAIQGAMIPLHAQAGFTISDALVLAGLTFTVVGLAALSQGAPTREEQRQARRNPVIEAEALEEMAPARRRYAVAMKTRDQLISLLKWQNPRGLYRDDERAQAGLYPLTHASAAKLVHQMVGTA